MNFKEWNALNESLKIMEINPEDEWELADDVYNILKKINIRSSRDKDVSIVALNDKDEVIGGVLSVLRDKDNYAEFSFDVVVHPDWQGYELVGIKLIKAAEEQKRQLEIMYDKKIEINVWVVNPKLAKVLQTPRYGYNSDGQWTLNNPFLTKY